MCWRVLMQIKVRRVTLIRCVLVAIWRWKEVCVWHEHIPYFFFWFEHEHILGPRLLSFQNYLDIFIQLCIFKVALISIILFTMC